MDPVLSAAIAVLAAGASVGITIWLHDRETHKRLPWWGIALVTVWFLATYLLIAFAVIPRGR